MRTLMIAALTLLSIFLGDTSAQAQYGFDPRGGRSIGPGEGGWETPRMGWNGGWGASPWVPWDGVAFPGWNETSSGRTKVIKLPDGRKVRAQFCPRDANGRPIGWVMFGVSCTQQNAERFADLLYGSASSAAPAQYAQVPSPAAESARSSGTQGPNTLSTLPLCRVDAKSGALKCRDS